MDTVGEFVRDVRNSGFGFSVYPNLPIFRPNGPRREFANSISNGTGNRNKGLYDEMFGATGRNRADLPRFPLEPDV